MAALHTHSAIPKTVGLDGRVASWAAPADSVAFLFLRTTADTEGTLSGAIDRQLLLRETHGSAGLVLRQISDILGRRLGVGLSDAHRCDLQDVPRAKRLMAQSFVYLACATLGERRLEGAAVACSSYSRGAFPALLWAGIVTVEEFDEWGEDYLHLQRTRIDMASRGRDLGHCEILLAEAYSAEQEIERHLAKRDIWIKDYRAPRVLLLAGDRRGLERLVERGAISGNLRLGARTPVTPCNAAHLPCVDPLPQQAYLSRVPVHQPRRIFVAQATGRIARNGSHSEAELRDTILHSGIGPMRTYEALCSLRLIARDLVAVGTTKSYSAVCTDADLQPHPVSHLPVGIE